MYNFVQNELFLDSFLDYHALECSCHKKTKQKYSAIIWQWATNFWEGRVASFVNRSHHIFTLCKRARLAQWWELWPRFTNVVGLDSKLSTVMCGLSLSVLPSALWSFSPVYSSFLLSPKTNISFDYTCDVVKFVSLHKKTSISRALS